ncbi:MULTISPECIES: FUSC family protein [unclassified Romboutsia]|uniref:FUSC family protein n=1 Tax=unclassified Romboutsia TaxID=2626894 RepID=UPI001A9AEAAD|nr:FUSC family protein [Romboutsia sp. 1001216sp1]
MKIDIKKQIKNMKIFLISAIAIFSFMIFGKENVLIGIATVSIAASMFGENHTINVPRRIIILSLIQIVIGVAAYIASLDIFLAYIVSLILSFWIYYRFSYELKTPKTAGFMMLYILLLYYPVTFSQMPKRILALIFSSFVIMALYYIITKYNFYKVTDKQITGAIDLIKKEIDLLLDNKNIKDENKKVSILLKTIQINIYEVIEKSSKELDDIYILEVIVILLKKINTTISYIKENEIYEDRLLKLKCILEDVNLYILGKKDIKDIKITFRKYYNELELENIEGDLARYNYYNLRLAIDETCRYIEDKSRGEKIRKRLNLQKKLKSNIDIFKNNFNMSSLRFNIALKASLVISTFVFIVGYFNIYEGKWIVLSLALILLPYAEQGSKKAIDRVVGTVVGAIIFELIYRMIDKNIILIGAVFLIALYFALSIKKYNIRCIFTTMTAILAVKMLQPSAVIFKLLEDRVIFVLIAAIVAWLAMNMVFPYRIKNDMKNIMKKYVDFDNETLDSIVQGTISKKDIETITIKNNYFWMRINYINKQMNLSCIEEFLSKQNDIFTNINFTILISGSSKDKSILIKKLLEKLNPNLNEEDLFKVYKNIFETSKNDLEKSLIISLYRIYLDKKDIDMLESEIIEKLNIA